VEGAGGGGAGGVVEAGLGDGKPGDYSSTLSVQSREAG
jgi:hypothetical protein